MGNNQTRSAQGNVHELSAPTQVNESNEWSLDFFRNRAFAVLLLSSLYAFVQYGCSKSELGEELAPKNRSRGGCNDVICILKFEPNYVVAERENRSGDDMSIAMHLLINGASAEEVKYVDDNGLCLSNTAGDVPMPQGRSMLPSGETYRDTFYYSYLSINGKPLQPGAIVQMQTHVQPMRFDSGKELCIDEGTVATVPGE